MLCFVVFACSQAGYAFVLSHDINSEESKVGSPCCHSYKCRCFSPLHPSSPYPPQSLPSSTLLPESVLLPSATPAQPCHPTQGPLKLNAQSHLHKWAPYAAQRRYWSCPLCLQRLPHPPQRHLPLSLTTVLYSTTRTSASAANAPPIYPLHT